MELSLSLPASGEELLVVWLVGLPEGIDRRSAARDEALRQSAAARTDARARRFRELLLEVAALPPPVPGRRRRAAH